MCVCVCVCVCVCARACVCVGWFYGMPTLVGLFYVKVILIIKIPNNIR